MPFLGQSFYIILKKSDKNVKCIMLHRNLITFVPMSPVVSPCLSPLFVPLPRLQL